MKIDKINWEEVTRRNILSKAVNIYEAMGWNTFTLFDKEQLTLF